jgi:hypothetical protein
LNLSAGFSNKSYNFYWLNSNCRPTYAALKSQLMHICMYVGRYRFRRRNKRWMDWFMHKCTYILGTYYFCWAKLNRSYGAEKITSCNSIKWTAKWFLQFYSCLLLFQQCLRKWDLLIITLLGYFVRFAWPLKNVKHRKHSYYILCKFKWILI